MHTDLFFTSGLAIAALQLNKERSQGFRGGVLCPTLIRSGAATLLRTAGNAYVNACTFHQRQERRKLVADAKERVAQVISQVEQAVGSPFG